MNLFRFESYRRGILFSSLANVAAQGLVFATSVIFAGIFGTQASTDVYYYCLAMVTLIAGFLTSINTSVILPEAMRLAQQAGAEASMRFVNLFFYSFLALGGVLTLALLARPLEILLALSRFDPLILAEYRTIVIWSVPLCGLMILAQFLVDILSAHKFFTLPMLFNMLNRLLVLGAMVGLHERHHILSIVWAGLAATVTQIVLCLHLLRRAAGWRFGIVAWGLEPRIVRNIGFSLSGNITATLAAGIPVALLSGFPAGVLTAMNMAQRLAGMPMSLLGGQIANVMGIRFNEQVAKHDWDGVNRSFAESVRATGLLLIPASLFLCVFGHEVVRVFFERGSFDARSSDLVGMYFRLFALALPLAGINALVGRVFMAGQKIKEGFFYQIASNLVLIALILVAVRLFGAPGFPAANLAFAATNLLALNLVFRFWFPQVRYGQAAAQMAPMFAVHGLIALAALLLKRWCGHAPDAALLAGGLAVCGALPLWQCRSFLPSIAAKRSQDGLPPHAVREQS